MHQDNTSTKTVDLDLINEIQAQVKKEQSENKQQVDIPQSSKDSKGIIAHHNSIAKLKSVEAYIAVVNQVVTASKNNLGEIQRHKQKLRKPLIWFFIILLSLQFLGLYALIMIKGFYLSFNISETLLITFMTSVFVETLGAIGIMIKYAFKDDEEVNIIKILNAVVEKFQKEDT